MAEMINTLVKAIKTLVVILIVVAITFIFFRQVLPALRGEALTPQELQENENSFNALVDNIEKCVSFQDDDCVCDGLPNFPGSFAIDSKLIFKELPEHKVQINLTHGNKNYRSQTLEDLKLSVMFPTKEESYRPEKTIEFAKEPPELVQEGLAKRWPVRKHYPRLMTGSLYKNNGLFFIIDYKKTAGEPAFRKCS